MLTFHKYCGAGNDFILIEDREENFLVEIIPKLCDRKYGIGADGLILIQNSAVADARMRYFNADGSSAKLCGNGLRCVALHLFSDLEKLLIETDSGVLTVNRRGEKIFTHLGKAVPICWNLPLSLLGTVWTGFGMHVGVPHLVFFVPDVEQIDVETVGSAARFHSHFAPEGVNVNFAQKIGKSQLLVRTYERGVEGETLACGTGAAAVAATAQKLWGLNEVIQVITRSGDCLEVEVGEEICLSGPAYAVFHGVLT